MSDPVSTARSARENLRQGLAALQAPGVPLAVTQAAEPVAQAMGALHQIEASGGAGLAQHAPVALEAVRRALGMLQGQPPAVPAVSQALEAVAGSLSLVHQLSQQSVMGNAATQRQQPSPVAAQPQYQPQPPAAGYGATVVQPPAPQAPAPQHYAQPQPAAGYPPQAPAGYGRQPQYQQPAPQAQYAQQPAAPQYQQPAAQPQYVQQPAPQQPQYQQPAPQAPYAQQPAAPQYQQPAPQPQYAQQPPQGFAPPAQAVHAPQPGAAAAPGQPPPGQSPPGQWPQRISTHPPPPGGGPLTVEAELGAHSATNFYKGLSGNDVIDSGGIFIATYQIPELGQPLTIKVSLPGGYEFEAAGVVRWTREAPHSTRGVESPPGFGAQFTNISQEGRQLVYRYVRNREPLFHDDL